jgi:hypothetical protein
VPFDQGCESCYDQLSYPVTSLVPGRRRIPKLSEAGAYEHDAVAETQRKSEEMNCRLAVLNKLMGEKV